MPALAIINDVAATAPTLAQDQAKPLKTLRIREPAPEVTSLYKVEADGTVRIDWETVETLATSKADRIMLPMAQVMLAVRDETWKPMK